jgi:AcrR family transcriptional regulator
MAEMAVKDSPPVRRRDRQRAETRRDLALAAFSLAREQGLANVRVPDIARAAGVSTRTFNNYFASKEQAIAWLAGQHAAGMASALRGRPADEPLREALVVVVTGQYRPAQENGRPPHWLRDFRALVAREPALHGEYLTAMAAAERELAGAIAARLPGEDQLRARVLAAMVAGAERAAVMHWMQTRTGTLAGTVRQAVEEAVAGIGARS